jgi:hypothetical protein
MAPVVPAAPSSVDTTCQGESGTYAGARSALAVRPWILAVGTSSAVISAGFGLARALEGRSDVLPLFIIAAAAAIIPAILSTLAVMYQARQETLRKEIEHRGADRLAAALARYIDAGHVTAQDLPDGRQAEEAEQVRASAAQIMTASSSAITALLGQRPDQPHFTPLAEQSGATACTPGVDDVPGRSAA